MIKSYLEQSAEEVYKSCKENGYRELGTKEMSEKGCYCCVSFRGGLKDEGCWCCNKICEKKESRFIITPQ